MRKSFNDSIEPIDFFNITQFYFGKEESSASDSLDLFASKVGEDKTENIADEHAILVNRPTTDENIGSVDATTITFGKSVDDTTSHKELLSFGLKR